MTQEEVKQNIYRNSISNYVFLVIRLGLGLVLFRLIWQSLSKEEFGFWALMWSVFGFGILLDFGFGFTAQKRVAELSAHSQWDQLSRVLSTIFYCYVGIAALMMLIGIVGAPFIVKAFKVSAENEGAFSTVLMIFLIGMGLNFPIGIFPEMLRGQQRISLANYTLLGGYLISFVLVVLCLHFKMGLIALIIATLVCSLVSELACGYFALRKMPQVKILPSLFSKEMVHDTMRFSIFAYITTLTTVILTRTDQLILSTTLAVSAVAVYQAGAKVAEMFSSFALQVPETLSPAAAHLHARGDKEFLRKLLVEGTRYSVMIATPMYLLCAFYMDEILWLLTGELQLQTETFWVGQVLLLWGYVTILTQSVSKRIFMMSGHERRLMWLGVGEALMNLALSLALVLYYKNVVCVAVGSLVATFVFGCFFIWPWAAREANLSAWNLARAVALPTWIACLPVAVVIILERQLTTVEFRTSVYALVVEAAIVFVLAAWCMWRMALQPGERARFSTYLNRFFSKGTVA